MENFLIKNQEEFIIKINVKTGSKKPGVEIIDNETIKIRLQSKPHNGLANRELIEILSDILNVSKSKIEIIKGTTSKNKIIKIKR